MRLVQGEHCCNGFEKHFRNILLFHLHSYPLPVSSRTLSVTVKLVSPVLAMVDKLQNFPCFNWNKIVFSNCQIFLLPTSPTVALPCHVMPRTVSLKPVSRSGRSMGSMFSSRIS